MRPMPPAGPRSDRDLRRSAGAPRGLRGVRRGARRSAPGAAAGVARRSAAPAGGPVGVPAGDRAEPARGGRRRRSCPSPLRATPASPASWPTTDSPSPMLVTGSWRCSVCGTSFGTGFPTEISSRGTGAKSSRSSCRPWSRRPMPRPYKLELNRFIGPHPRQPTPSSTRPGGSSPPAGSTIWASSCASSTIGRSCGMRRRGGRLEIGDVLLSIGGEAVEAMVAHHAPHYPASNEAARLRDMARRLTPRAPRGPSEVQVQRGSEVLTLSLERRPTATAPPTGTSGPARPCSGSATRWRTSSRPRSRRTKSPGTSRRSRGPAAWSSTCAATPSG